MNISDFINNNKSLQLKEYQISNKTVIYFICKKDGSILYIGKTADLHLRAMQHRSNIELYGLPIYYFECPKDKCRKIEKDLIKNINPPYNSKKAGFYEEYGYKPKTKININTYKLNLILDRKGINQSKLDVYPLVA